MWIHFSQEKLSVIVIKQQCLLYYTESLFTASLSGSMWLQSKNKRINPLHLQLTSSSHTMAVDTHIVIDAATRLLFRAAAADGINN